MTITKTLKVTAVMAVLTFATFFMASGFSSLTMGSYPISDVFAQGGTEHCKPRHKPIK